MAVTVKELQLLIKNMCEIIIENEQYFCELDSAAGDGDFGMSLAKGFREVQKREDSISTDSMQTYLRGVCPFPMIYSTRYLITQPPITE